MGIWQVAIVTTPSLFTLTPSFQQFQFRLKDEEILGRGRFRDISLGCDFLENGNIFRCVGLLFGPLIEIHLQ